MPPNTNAISPTNAAALVATDSCRELDFSTLAGVIPTPPRLLLPALGALPIGEVTLLAGDGGIGKSILALHLMICIASGRPFFGQAIQQRRACYLSFEDGEETLKWRVWCICKAIGIEPGELSGWLRVIDLQDSTNAWFDRDETGRIGFTAEFDRARGLVRDAEVVVVDGLSDVFAGDENKRSEVKRFARGVRLLAPKDGALVLLGHVEKDGLKDGRRALGYSGSTAWNNAVRNRLHMFRDQGEETSAVAKSNGDVLLVVRKSNYGPTGGAIRMRYDGVGHVLVGVDGTEDQSRAASRDAKEKTAIIGIIASTEASEDPVPASTSGGRTAAKVMLAHKDFPESLSGKRGSVRLYAHLEALRRAGTIVVKQQIRPNRHRTEVYGLPARSTCP